MAANNFAEIVADDIITQTVNLNRFDASLRREMLDFLFRLQEDITNQISTISPTSLASPTFKHRRLQLLNEQVAETIRTAYRGVRGRSSSRLRALSELQLEAAVTRTNALIRVDLLSVTITPELLQTIVSDALIEGAPTAEWWGRQSAQLRRRFSDQMRIGVAANEPNQLLIQRVRGNHTGKFRKITLKSGKVKRVGIFRGGLMDVTTREAETLVRSSVQAIANTARLQVYKKNSNVIKAVQALVTFDNKTSSICIARGALPSVWKLNGDPVPPTIERFPGSPPWHHNCRSTLTPITKSFRELTGKKSKLSKRKINKLDKDVPKSRQASMNGLVAGDIGYEDWLRTKPVGTQIDILGRGKYELWKEGKIPSLTKLIDQTGRPLTLAELKDKFL